MSDNNYWNRRVVRVRNINNDIIKVQLVTELAKVVLEKLIINENEVCIYVSDDETKEVVTETILTVLNNNQPCLDGRIFTDNDDVEVNSTIVVVTNVPKSITEANMDALMKGFGKTLTKFEFIKFDGINFSKIGWIVFEDIESAESCVSKLHTTRIKSSRLYCSLVPENVTGIDAILSGTTTTQIHGFSEKQCNEERIREILKIVCKNTLKEVKFVRAKSVKHADGTTEHVALIDWQAASHTVSSFKQFERFSNTKNVEISLEACFCLPGITAFDDLFKSFDDEQKLENEPPQMTSSPNHFTQKNDKKDVCYRANGTPQHIPPLMSVVTPITNTTPPVYGVPSNQHVLQQQQHPVRYPNGPYNQRFPAAHRMNSPQNLIQALSNVTQLSPHQLNALGNQVFFRNPAPSHVLYPRHPPPNKSYAQQKQKSHYVASQSPRQDTNNKFISYIPQGVSGENKLKDKPSGQRVDKENTHDPLNDPSIIKCGGIANVGMNTPPPGAHFELVWNKSKNKKRWSATRPKTRHAEEGENEMESRSLGFSQLLKDDEERLSQSPSFDETSSDVQKQKTLLDCLEIKEERSRLSDWLTKISKPSLERVESKATNVL